MKMYDTETATRDPLRHEQQQIVDAWMRAAAYAADTAPQDASFAAPEELLGEVGLEEAVESKKRDNLALGEALLSIGLIAQHEFARVQSEQTEDDDLVGALVVASAVRSRLGEILLKANCITSPQLELALELQRRQGGLLGEVLVSLGWVDCQTLDAALATQASRTRPE
jgi:hypothetical protein